MDLIRKVNADAMLICAVFLMFAVSVSKFVYASTDIQLAINTIEMVELTKQRLHNVFMQQANTSRPCARVVAVSKNVEV